MNGTIKVRGGNKLLGDVEPIPNKNSFMGALSAAILTDKDILYKNLPQTSDVEKFLQIYQQLGAKVESKNEGVVINCKNLNSFEIDAQIAGTFRGAFTFVGPLLARFGRAKIPIPGGCLLGTRAMHAHIGGFLKMGVEIKEKDGFYFFKAPLKVSKNYRVWQLEPSVTGTENLIMYTAGINAKTEIIDVACEPHVVDLLHLLVEMGAKIEGIGSNKLLIRGKEDLGGGKFVPSPDHVDIAGFMVAAAVTDGKIRIKGANILDIVDGIIAWMELFGVAIDRDGSDLIVSRADEFRIRKDYICN